MFYFVTSLIIFSQKVMTALRGQKPGIVLLRALPKIMCALYFPQIKDVILMNSTDIPVKIMQSYFKMILGFLMRLMKLARNIL